MACHLTYACAACGWWVVGGGLAQEALQRQLEAATTATNKQASIAAVAEETAARTKEDLTAARIETQAVQSMLTGKTCVAGRVAFVVCAACGGPAWLLSRWLTSARLHCAHGHCVQAGAGEGAGAGGQVEGGARRHGCQGPGSGRGCGTRGYIVRVGGCRCRGGCRNSQGRQGRVGSLEGRAGRCHELTCVAFVRASSIAMPRA